MRRTSQPKSGNWRLYRYWLNNIHCIQRTEQDRGPAFLFYLTQALQWIWNAARFASKAQMMLMRYGWLFTAFLLMVFSGVYWIHLREQRQNSRHITETSKRNTTGTRFYGRLRQRATSLLQYARVHGYSTHWGFCIDMAEPSGRFRFHVVDFRGDSVWASGLVTHGSGSDRPDGRLYFSNQPNSHCTSLGRYAIGRSYNGEFGLAYKLHGLDSANSKAFDRFVVLHAHDCVPNEEVYPSAICLSFGCPTVSPAFLQSIKPILDASAQPVLLWIYD